MNDTYILGKVSAKLTTLLKLNDYEALKSMSKKNFFDYLFQKNITDTRILDLEVVINNIVSKLSDEVLSYIGEDHPIYQYFFTTDKSLKNLNRLYDFYMEKNSESRTLSKLHLEKNMILMYRLIDLEKDVNVFKQNILNQNEVSKELLIDAFRKGRIEVDRLSKSLFSKVFDGLTTVEIEEELDDYLTKYMQTLSYSSETIELVIYYIYMNFRQIEKLKSIHYLGDYWYGKTNIFE